MKLFLDHDVGHWSAAQAADLSIFPCRRTARSLAVLLAALLSPALPAASPTDLPTPSPTLLGLRKEHDFGRVRPGVMLKHSIPVTNLSAAALELGLVHASCSCVVLGQATRHLGPGEVGTIPLEFYTGGVTGPLQETIIIDAPGSARPLATIQLRARVWLPIQAEPQFLVLSRPPTQAASMAAFARTIRITNQVDAPVSLAKPVGESKSFSAELKVRKPGREFDLVVTPVPPFSSGNIYGRFVLKTSLKEMPELEVTAYIPAVGLPASGK